MSKDFASNADAVLHPGCLLITATGVGSAGRVLLLTDDAPMVADAHVTVLTVNDIQDAAYLCAYLQSPIGKQQLLRLHRGSSRQIEIYPEDILAVLVPEIDATVRSSIGTRWLQAADAVRRSRGAVNEAEAQILDVGGVQPRTYYGNDKTWSTDLSALSVGGRRIDAEYAFPPIERLRRDLLAHGAIPLRDLVISVGKGFQPEGYTGDGPTRVIKSKDVHYPDLDLAECSRTDDDDWPSYLRGGELLLNSTGQGTLGRSTVVPPRRTNDPLLIPSVDLLVLELDRAVVVPEYVALFLNSDVGRSLTEALQTGSSGQQHLYPDHFGAIPVPLPRDAAGQPDLGRQRATVAIAERRLTALRDARRVAAELDHEFLDILGVPVDLSLVPA
ncbi:MAG: hypothetical protein ACR2MC_03510 [Actinomycetota bacterium]